MSLVSGLLIAVVAGKSLGEASLGEKKDALVSRGFTADTGRAGEYLEKGPIHVRLDKESAVEIWIDDIRELQPKLIYRKKPFPKSVTLETVTAFIGKCEAPVRGSGGLLVSCRNGGIQLGTSFLGKDISLSVLKK